MYLDNLKIDQITIKVSLIQHFEADFLWKVSLKILNSGLKLKTITHEFIVQASSAKCQWWTDSGPRQQVGWVTITVFHEAGPL